MQMKVIAGAFVLISSMQLHGASAKMLSSQEDTKDSDPSGAVRDSADATSFWGMSGVLGGTKDSKAVDVAEAVKVLQAYADKEENFYKAAFLISIRKRGDVIAALAESRSRNDKALAAAAMAVGVTGDFIQKERDAERIYVDHFGADGLKIDVQGATKSSAKGKGAANGKGTGKSAGKSGKGGGGRRHNLNFKGLVDPAVLTKLLAEDDPLTQYLAIQAAAYAKDISVKEIVAALDNSTGKVAAAKLFYAAMIGETVTSEDIIAAANLAARERPEPRGRVYSPDFNLDLPELCFVCRTIGVSGCRDALPVLNKCLGENPLVQSDAAWAVARLKSEESLPALNKAVATAPWHSLVPICKAVGMIPSEKLIPGLITRLAKEKGRVRLDLTHALSVIAGEQKAETADEWKKWWIESKDSFAVDPAASEAYRTKTRPQDVDIPANGVFYSLYIYSDHFCYVVDSSLSMKGDRISSLKYNLTESVMGLKDFVNYNIVDFGGDIEVMQAGKLTTSKSKGEQRVRDMDMSLATRSFCSMRAAMSIPETDSVYFLSDGAPAFDSMKTWADIRRAILILTRYCPTAVYCIDFDPSANNQLSMIDLADDNYGMHESIAVEAAPEGFDAG